MQFSEDKPTQQYVFHRANAHSVLINETLYTHSLFISVEPVLFEWNVRSISALNAELIAPLMQGSPDLILLGTAGNPVPLPQHLLALCWENRIGLETMTTPAAARTYNLLANEGRRVAIGLILGPTT